MFTKRVIFPGSFDPLTNGHVDIVGRALSVFGEVVVAVLNNPSKTPLFSAEERVALIQEHFQEDSRVRIETFSGLLVDFVRENKSNIILRGLRAISDFDYEAQMALMNRTLDPSVETFFLTAREENSYVSSSLVKQVAPFGGDVSKLVPAVVGRALQEKFGRSR